MWKWFTDLFSRKEKTMTIGKESIDLILEFEGIDQPWKRPPGDSGITLGYGVDLGYTTVAEFTDYWKRHLSLQDFNLLLTAIGKKGSAAEAIESRFRGITPITKIQAREVFDRCIVPKWTKKAYDTFPGLESLTPNQRGVLTSLVFNRGTLLEGSRRVEMKNIATILKSNIDLGEKVDKITTQFLAMQRVWPSDDPQSGHPGLRRRRRAEAALFKKG
jgi:GH24 family phage-related lysozyme (muramidase)